MLSYSSAGHGSAIIILPSLYASSLSETEVYRVTGGAKVDATYIVSIDKK